MDEMIEQTTVIEMLPTVPEKTPAEWKSHWQKEIAASDNTLAPTPYTLDELYKTI